MYQEVSIVHCAERALDIHIFLVVFYLSSQNPFIQSTKFEIVNSFGQTSNTHTRTFRKTLLSLLRISSNI